MKLLLATALVWAVGLMGSLTAADKDDLEHLENRVKQLNAQAQKPGMMDVALQRISTETGVPLENVRRQHERHPDVGVAGLMIANVLANDTKKSPETFLSEHAKGKKWLTIAKNNKVSVDNLNERLD